MSNPVSYIIFWVFCVYVKLLFICPAKTVISNKTACNDTVKYVNKLLMERISLIGMKSHQPETKLEPAYTVLQYGISLWAKHLLLYNPVLVLCQQHASHRRHSQYAVTYRLSDNKVMPTKFLEFPGKT